MPLSNPTTAIDLSNLNLFAMKNLLLTACMLLGISACNESPYEAVAGGLVGAFPGAVLDPIAGGIAGAVSGCD